MLSAQDALHSRFADMHKAFQYVDVDGSGTIDRSELERALELWGVPLEKRRLDSLWEMCDTTGDGEINYAEFVHALARDTTHKHQLEKQVKKPRETREQKQEREAVHGATEGFNVRFAKMRDAFKWADTDNSGTVSFNELERALHLLGVPMSEEKLDLLWAACDTNNSGEISYAEFVNAFARDTAEQMVAPVQGIPSKTAAERKQEGVLKMIEDKLGNRFQDMRKAFASVDLDRSGSVNRRELEQAFRMMNLQLNIEEMTALWEACDTDGSGEIDYQEFLNAFSHHHRALPQAAQVSGGYGQYKAPSEPVPQLPIQTMSNSPRSPTLRDLRLQKKAYEREERLLESARKQKDAAREAAAAAINETPRKEAEAEAAASAQAARWAAISIAQVGLNSRFKDMHKAFKYIDLDGSGTVDRSELERALKLWNVPHTKEQLDLLWGACDENGSGEISYAEFVNVLARDTAVVKVNPAGPARQRPSVEEEARQRKLQNIEDTLNSRFKDTRKAFKYVDLDNSGTVSRKEFEMAMTLMNLDLNADELDFFWNRCDVDGSGEVDYKEFVNGLTSQRDITKVMKEPTAFARPTRKY